MNEKIYIFKENQLLFLRETISNKLLKEKIEDVFEKKKIVVKNYLTGKYLITLSNQETCLLLDELTFLFTSKGLRENGEPNCFGLSTEELIDIFSR